VNLGHVIFALGHIILFKVHYVALFLKRRSKLQNGTRMNSQLKIQSEINLHKSKEKQLLLQVETKIMQM
jgi:hypothetical protein